MERGESDQMKTLVCIGLRSATMVELQFGKRGRAREALIGDKQLARNSPWTHGSDSNWVQVSRHRALTRGRGVVGPRNPSASRAKVVMAVDVPATLFTARAQ
jgi:hypothetical protein